MRYFEIIAEARLPAVWKNINITVPSSRSPAINELRLEFGDIKIIGLKTVLVAALYVSEHESFDTDGTTKAEIYAGRIEQDKTFPAIIVLTDGMIIDGHHRFRAVRDILKWKTIPVLMVEVLN